MRVVIVLASVAVGLLARAHKSAPRVWAALSLVLAFALAFPLRERIHLLGDTDARLRAVAIADARLLSFDLKDWAHWLHAQPLDVAVNWFLVLALRHAGLSVIRSVQLVSLGLALVMFAGVWRLSGALSRRKDVRLPVCCALTAWGGLEAFAGYAESAGLLVALGVWWWALLIEPLKDRWSAVRLAAMGALVALGHRQGFALVAPMLVRAWGPAVPGDQPAGRRDLPILVLVAMAVVLELTLLLPGGAPVGQDVADFLAVLRGWASGRRLPVASDVANLALLAAPLALLAPALGAGSPGTRARRIPAALAAASLALLLVPGIAVVIVGPHELGAHRDWDITVLLGLSLGVAAVAWLIARSEDHARRALLAAIPVLALLAGSWVCVNADATASESRAISLVHQGAGLSDEARSAIEVLLGQRLMNRRDARAAAPHFERAYAYAPNPRLLLVSAEARARAGEFAAARRDLERAWATRALNEKNQESARTIARMIDEMERGAVGDTTRPR